MTKLRDVWEATSFELEKRQCDSKCVEMEQTGLKSRKDPAFKLSYKPAATPLNVMSLTNKHKIAIIREEGSNGDREMCSAFFEAGFDVFDIAMNDLRNNKIKSLNQFKGIAFVGGFSYADVFGSAKGWAAASLFNSNVEECFKDFKNRPDTFSLGWFLMVIYLFIFSRNRNLIFYCIPID